MRARRTKQEREAAHFEAEARKKFGTKQAGRRVGPSIRPRGGSPAPAPSVARLVEWLDEDRSTDRASDARRRDRCPTLPGGPFTAW